MKPVYTCTLIWTLIPRELGIAIEAKYVQSNTQAHKFVIVR